MKIIIILLLAISSCTDNSKESSKQQQEATKEPIMRSIEALKNGTTCVPDQINGGMMCEFKIGNDLEFEMWGVGLKETSTIVGKSAGQDGDYSIRFVSGYVCPVITSEMKVIQRVRSEEPDKEWDFLSNRQAFVSPANGQPYDDADECQKVTEELTKNL